MPTIRLDYSRKRITHSDPKTLSTITGIGNNRNKKKVILAGPFIGDPKWECLYFCGFVLFLKLNKNFGLIVCTRPDRFDLYGQYADILVPLKLQGSKSSFKGFADESISSLEYHTYAKKLRYYYQIKFNVIKHIYPEILDFSSQIKWQFPRYHVNYSFRPRKKCYKMVQHLLTDINIFVSSNYDFTSSQFNVITSDDLDFDFDLTFSYLGCLIEVLRECMFSICDITSIEAQISLLMGVPVISREVISDEQLCLINPNNTLVIMHNDVNKGIDILQRWLLEQKKE